MVGAVFVAGSLVLGMTACGGSDSGGVKVGQGTLRLAALDQARSDVEIDGDLVAKVPLLGSKIEKAAVPYVSTVLRAEERSAAAYRDRPGA